MAEIKILTQEEISKNLALLPGWMYQDPSLPTGNKISKEFKFKDFMSSLDFVNALAPYCEQIDHHPDVHIFYSKVLFELQRFDVGKKVTDKDFLVARKIEELYRRWIQH